MIKKIRNFKFLIRNSQAGMTYVELIVVLSIFSVMTSIVLFNYGAFEANINIKILANDIALKLVEAQKSSISGKLPPLAQQTFINSTWKPSYGVYFDTATVNNKNFFYFVDLVVQNSFYDSSSCPGSGECLDNIAITKGSYISRIDSYVGAVATQISNPISITFKRPDSSAIFYSNASLLTGFDYMQITLSSASGAKAYIKIYPSGRIQIN